MSSFSKCDILTKEYMQPLAPTLETVEIEKAKKRNVAFSFEVKSINEEEFTLDGIFSTSDVDRQGEIVSQSEWQLDEYLKNPVVLFAHDHYRFAVGKMIALGFENGNLAGTIKFAVKENPEAKVIFDLYKGGYMRAFSVGFTAEPTYDDTLGIVVLHKPVLFEVSCVNVPANAMALAKSKGIDVSALEKEGRVLSKKNREHVEKAKTALEELLAADAVSREEQLPTKHLSTDNTAQVKKVETPRAVRAGSMYMEKKANRILKNAIRSLLKVRS